MLKSASLAYSADCILLSPWESISGTIWWFSKGQFLTLSLSGNCLHLQNSHSRIYDALHGVGGAYAKRIFVEELGANESSLLNCTPKLLMFRIELNIRQQSGSCGCLLYRFVADMTNPNACCNENLKPKYSSTMVSFKRACQNLSVRKTCKDSLPGGSGGGETTCVAHEA
ncbi:hypothetical protein NE237_032759 [Protea cynaroides]|uniref:Uncharacterized protein n=1 Tax=Protea cynaroides TaxID=273540 RepID=A0A9Q0L3P9_9MAGN|nr:hypothetical protein NE237_032759 [Protea cynaroides]